MRGAQEGEEGSYMIGDTLWLGGNTILESWPLGIHRRPIRV
jgi:hypothetical protein